MTKLLARLCLWLGPALTLAAAPAGAHPHAWIEMRTTVVFDEQGSIAALRVHWVFDELYTLFAIEGFDEDGDGVPDPGKLAELAELNIGNLAEYRYFTDFTADGAQVAYAAVEDYATAMEEQLLTLDFTVPLAAPVDPRRASVAYAVYDPTYYIEVLHLRDRPVVLEGAVPEGCGYALRQPSPDPDAASFAAALDKTQSGGDGLGVLFAEEVTLSCQ